MVELRWSANERLRRDGLEIVDGLDGLVILPGGEGVAVDRCPCCNLRFTTVRAARIVSDFIYPMMELDG